MHSNTIASHNLDTKPISNPSTRNLFNRVGSHVIHHLENCSTAAISADCVFKAVGTVNIYSAADFKPLGS